MASNERDSLYRLASFADSVLVPCLKGGSETWELASLVEAFLWLDLGVKVEAFHEEAANRLASEAAAKVSSALDTLEAAGAAELIPDHTRAMLRRSLSNRSWFQRDAMGYMGGGNLVPYFDSALLNAVEALRDWNLQQLFVHLHLDERHYWDAARTDEIDMVGLVTSCLGRWIDAERFVRELRNSEIDTAARIGLAGDLASIQSWRFGFSSPAARQRILDAVRRAANFMGDAVSESSDDRQSSVDAVIEELTDMMSRWEKHVELQLDNQFAGA